MIGCSWFELVVALSNELTAAQGRWSWGRSKCERAARHFLRRPTAELCSHLPVIIRVCQQIEAASSSGERPATPLPSPLAVRAALSHSPHPTMRRNQALSLLGLLALAAGALALRPEPAAGAADLHVAATSDDKDLPWFCHNLQCPRFTVVNTTEDYEVCVLVWWRCPKLRCLGPAVRQVGRRFESRLAAQTIAG